MGMPMRPRKNSLSKVKDQRFAKMRMKSDAERNAT